MIHFQAVREDACEFLALLVCSAQHVASLLDCSKIVTIVQNAPQHVSGENQATIRSLVANSMSGRLCPILNLPRRVLMQSCRIRCIFLLSYLDMLSL